MRVRLPVATGSEAARVSSRTRDRVMLLNRPLPESAVPGFTLIELLVSIAIIGILLGLILPNFAAVQQTAKSAAAQAYLQAFGKGFLDHATLDGEGRLSTGSFDHYRDGDIRSNSWVGDLVKAKLVNPARSLDPLNRSKVCEETAAFAGAIDFGGKLNEFRWADTTRYDGSPVDVSAANDICGIDYFGPRQTLLDDGFNTNFATTWHFSRGDNLVTGDGDGRYATDGDPQDMELCPLDGDGPLSTRHLADATMLTSADKILLMGPAQIARHDRDHGHDVDGDGHSDRDTIVDPSVADVFNRFADPSGRRRVLRGFDALCESMTDGPIVDVVPGTRTAYADGDSGDKCQSIADIAPIHKSKRTLLGGDYRAVRLAGGFAPLLFADGSCRRVYDTDGFGGHPDSWLGPHQEMPEAAEEDPRGRQVLGEQVYVQEIRDEIWLGRIRAALASGGGSL